MSVVQQLQRDVPPGPAPKRRDTTAKIIHAVGVMGKIFVVLGLILLFFTGYLLWGTGVYTAQEQERATQELAANPIVDQAALNDGEVPPARPEKFVGLGEPLFTLKIPRIGLEHAIVEGVGRTELTKGIGHFPDCADVGNGVECVDGAVYPGEAGNVALSGHRTTYGAPFFRLNELKDGDPIDFVSGRARYRYRVTGQEIVDPVGGYNVVEQHGRTELTLTTCHPRFSAAQRLIIHADYEGSSIITDAPAPALNSASEPATAGGPVVAPDVLILASIALASGLGSLAMSPRWRKTAAYTATAMAGAAGLWVGVFPRVLALMPANF